MSNVGKGHCDLYKASTKREREENERLTGEGDKIKFIDFRLERGQAIEVGKGGRRQDAP